MCFVSFYDCYDNVLRVNSPGVVFCFCFWKLIAVWVMANWVIFYIGEKLVYRVSIYGMKGGIQYQLVICKGYIKMFKGTFQFFCDCHRVIFL